MHLLVASLCCSAVLVDDLGGVVGGASHDQGLLVPHVGLARDAVIHGVCVLFGQGLPRRLLHVLLHELLLVEFLLLWTATCACARGLIYGLTAQAAHVLDRLMARLLVGSSLLRLLLQKLHLLLLVVGQH